MKGVSFIKFIARFFLYFLFLTEGAPLIDNRKKGSNRGTLIGVLYIGSVII